MRGTKTFSIEGHSKQFKVRELTLREILEIFDPETFKDMNIVQFFERFRTDILPKATNIKPQELLELAPSEIDAIWDQFKEVNKVFFGLSSRMPLVTELLSELKPAVFGLCGNFVVDWLSRVMSMRRSMDSDTSSMPAMSTSESDSKNSLSEPTPQEPHSSKPRSGKSSSVPAASAHGGKQSP